MLLLATKRRPSILRSLLGCFDLSFRHYKARLLLRLWEPFEIRLLRCSILVLSILLALLKELATIAEPCRGGDQRICNHIRVLLVIDGVLATSRIFTCSLTL